MGIVESFNSLDVLQTQDYIKVSCQSYLRKLLTSHQWSDIEHEQYNPVPMNHDSRYVHNLEQNKGPENLEEQQILAIEMKFSYQQAVEELLFAAITCRSDILHHVIKLSQFSN